MIRFVNVTGQITFASDDFWFAWYDTITDTFMEFNNTQVWSSWKEFEEDLNKSNNIHSLEKFKELYKGQKDNVTKLYKNIYKFQEIYDELTSIIEKHKNIFGDLRKSLLTCDRYRYYFPVKKLFEIEKKKKIKDKEIKEH